MNRVLAEDGVIAVYGYHLTGPGVLSLVIMPYFKKIILEAVPHKNKFYLTKHIIQRQADMLEQNHYF